MIEQLLTIDKSKRAKVLRKIKVETKRHIFKCIPTLTEELELNGIESYEERVRMRWDHIQKFPDVVFWDFVEYQEYEKDNRITFDNLLVSTNGDFVQYGKDNRLHVNAAKTKGLNNYRAITIDNGNYQMHRAVASTFIPKTERVIDIPLHKLVLNHKDHVKYHNFVSNLEWVTILDNNRHGANHDGYLELEYFMFEVIIDNGFKGRKFILPYNNLDEVNIIPTQLRARTQNKIRNFWKGMNVSNISSKDVDKTMIGMPDDIKELFNKDERYFDIGIKPLIGTVIAGSLKGYTFSVFGRTESMKYFDEKSVTRVLIKERPQHMGCVFKRSTHKEALPLHGKLTPEVYSTIRKEFGRK